MTDRPIPWRDLDDLDATTGHMKFAIRESWGKSSRLDLTPEHLVAALLIAWNGIRGDLLDVATLERGRVLAEAAMDQVAGLADSGNAAHDDVGHEAPYL